MSKTLTEETMEREFRRGFDFPPLQVTSYESLARPGADKVVQLGWGSNTYDFTAEFKSRSTPKVFREAVQQVLSTAKESETRPMVVLPYLRPRQLDELQEQGVSGLDLSGNGVVVVPGELLVYRTGNRNRFPESASNRYAYRGTTSLVGRAFLCRPTYDSLVDIEREIRERGGSAAISTVSKALRRMEEDLIVDRGNGSIRLQQPDKLLESLAENWRPPKIGRTVTLSARVPLGELLSESESSARVAMSGASSITAYAVMGRDDVPVVYTDDIDQLVEGWGDGLTEPTSRFVDLELRETDDPTVYFDVREREGLPYASPVQAFVEARSGDKRDRETAEQIQKAILDELRD